MVEFINCDRFTDRGPVRSRRLFPAIAAVAILLLGAGASNVLTQTNTCNATGLYPTSASVPSQGGSGSFTFNLSSGTGYGCQASSNQSWVNVNLIAGSSSGTVNYVYAANPASSPRAATITVGTSNAFFPITQAAPAAATLTTALPGDRLVVGQMTLAQYSALQSIPLPAFANQKYCGLVQLGSSLFAEAYVPTTPERQGNFNAFSGILVDPSSNLPFPGGIIPSSRLPNPWAWRISGFQSTGQYKCAVFPGGIPFSSIYYTSAQLHAPPILITSVTPTSIPLNGGSFTLTIHGSGLLQGPDTAVLFNGNSLSPVISSSVLLTVSVPATLLPRSPGPATVAVVTPSLSLTSNSFPVQITSAPGPFINVSTSANSLPQLNVPNVTVGKNVYTGTVNVAPTATQTVTASVVQLSASPQNWISVSPLVFQTSPPSSGLGLYRPLASPPVANSTTVTVNTSGLPPGNYNAIVTLVSSSGDTKAVSVTANVSGVGPIPTPPYVLFTSVLGSPANGSAPLARMVVTGTPSFSVSTTNNNPWLSALKDSANAGTVDISANPQGLASSTYSGQVILTSTADPTGNTFVPVPVGLNVRSAPDTQVSFPPYLYGGPLPAVSPVPLAAIPAANPNPVTFSLDLNSEMNWLVASPLNGDTGSTQAIQFSVDPNVAPLLSPGPHTAYVTAVDQAIPHNNYLIAVLLTVPSPPVPLSITTASLPNGTVNQQYPATTLTATGGTAPYTWSVPAASMPPGLSLANGVISGKPTTANTYTIPVTVMDISMPPVTANTNFMVTIAPAVVTNPKPTILTAKNAASEETFIAPNTFVEIKGTNLASGMPADWSTVAFPNGQLPLNLGGVSVTINGKPAYVNYVSANQVNVLSRADDTTVGNVQVVLTNNGIASDPFTVAVKAVAPAFFQYYSASGTYVGVAATHTDTTPVAPVGIYSASRPAKPGESITLWGTGFGPTNPAIPNGLTVTSAKPLISPLTIQIGGTTVNYQYEFAGLQEAGLYQINTQIPANAPDGNLTILGTLQGGTQTLVGMIAVQH